MGRVLLGIVLGVILVPAAGLGYLKYGRVPVAVTDDPLPYEKFAAEIPLASRIEFEQVKNPPVQANEDSFVAGAHIYAQECAVCHGFHGNASRFGVHMAPKAPMLWEKHGSGDAVGVSSDQLGATYWKVENGIRLTGMPGFKGILTPVQMWQVSILLANANKPLPPEAVEILKGQAQGTESGSAAATPQVALPAGQKVEVSGSAN